MIDTNDYKYPYSKDYIEYTKNYLAKNVSVELFDGTKYENGYCEIVNPDDIYDEDVPSIELNVNGELITIFIKDIKRIKLA